MRIPYDDVPNHARIDAGIVAQSILRRIGLGNAGLRPDGTDAPPPGASIDTRAQQAATPAQIGVRDLPPFPKLTHPASMMHGRGKRTTRKPSPATLQSSWARTALSISPIQPSPATMGKIERVHEFLQRRWTARQQHGELHLQNGRTALKRKIALANNVSSSHAHYLPTARLI